MIGKVYQQVFNSASIEPRISIRNVDGRVEIWMPGMTEPHWLLSGMAADITIGRVGVTSQPMQIDLTRTK